MPDFDATPAAHLLARAWRDDAQIVELPAPLRPRNLRHGYDIQDLVAAQLGDATVGWKLGVGSPSAMRKAALAEIEKIVASTKSSHYGVRSLIHALVQSDLFVSK